MSSDFYTHSILPYASIIAKISRAYSNVHEDYEDNFQEVCLQLWRSKDNFKEQSEWSTWVYQVALNVCMTMSKREKRRKEEGAVFNSTIEHPSLDEQAISQEITINHLYEAIRLLSSIDRAIIILYLEEKSYKEIAGIIGITPNNLGVRIQRIKKRLNKLLSKTRHNE
ncbi:MAG: RNA polymerase sigma-70 factor (ECF subfamily) [Saprospiraceae bacterium]